MMELADVSDSKSDGSDTVRVRPPLPAPKNPECESTQDFYFLPLHSSLFTEFRIQIF